MEGLDRDGAVWIEMEQYGNEGYGPSGGGGGVCKGV